MKLADRYSRAAAIIRRALKSVPFEARARQTRVWQTQTHTARLQQRAARGTRSARIRCQPAAEDRAYPAVAAEVGSAYQIGGALSTTASTREPDARVGRAGIAGSLQGLCVEGRTGQDRGQRRVGYTARDPREAGARIGVVLARVDFELAANIFGLTHPRIRTLPRGLTRTEEHHERGRRNRRRRDSHPPTLRRATETVNAARRIR